jgi:hypothetical protein
MRSNEYPTRSIESTWAISTRWFGSRSLANEPRGFGIGVAGFPEGHPTTPNRLKELDWMVGEWVDEIGRDFRQSWMPPEVRKLARTVIGWKSQIVAWRQAHVTNGPTEAINNLVKRVKRVAFGFRRFDHYRIRALLYAGRPNWTLLDTITPP